MHSTFVAPPLLLALLLLTGTHVDVVVVEGFVLYSSSPPRKAEKTAPTTSSSQSSSPPPSRRATILRQQQQQQQQLMSNAWQIDLTLSDLHDLLDTAQRAALAAGSIIAEHSGCGSHRPVFPLLSSSSSSVNADAVAAELTVKTNIKDIVTSYDKEAQSIIEQIIRAQYPDHAFLGEEDVPAGSAASAAALQNALSLSSSSSSSISSSSDYLWICDPIDGTANFAAGLPWSAVTLACCYQGTPVIGVVYDPHAQQLFAAVRGQGATCTSITTTSSSSSSEPSGTTTATTTTTTPLRVADAVTDVRDAIVNAGCPADPQAYAASLRGMLALNARVRGVRVVACSALTTAWIAAGRLTAHYGYDI